MADTLLGSLTSKGIVVNQKYLDLFWSFIQERHMVWYRRFVIGQKAPWTTNPVMLTYKFTNVYRELDRGTIFLLDNILGHGTEMEQVFNIIVYRMFNRIDTWKATGFLEIRDEGTSGANWEKQTSFILWRNRKDAGLSLYTDATIVCAYAQFPGRDKLERFEYIFDHAFAGLVSLMKIIRKAKSLETVHKALTMLPGIGPFLAYEMAVDISYADWNNLGEDEWVNPGPGSQSGLKKMFPGLKTSDCTWMLRVLRQAQRREFQRLGLPFFDIAYQGKELTLRNIEHCTCELQKFIKAIEGTGRPRNKFVARSKRGSEDFNRLKG